MCSFYIPQKSVWSSLPIVSVDVVSLVSLEVEDGSINSETVKYRCCYMWGIVNYEDKNTNRSPK